MKVTYTKRFLQKLTRQTRYIAKDKPFAAEKFEIDLLNKTLEIPNAPYSYKKSPFFEDESIREIIFKG